MSFQFITTGMTDATIVTASIAHATISIVTGSSVIGSPYNGTTGLTTTVITSGSGAPASMKLYFVNGLFVSSSL